MIRNDDESKVKTVLNLQYKGDRNYLQGGDIFNALTDELKAKFGSQAFVSSINYKDLFKQAVELIIAPADKALTGQKATFTGKNGDELIQGALVETDVDVLGRTSYDESLVVDKCTFGENSISQEQRGGFSAMEEIVSITKALHQKMYDIEGKWLFVQAGILEALVEDDGLYTVIIKSTVGQRYTRSIISKNGKEIGWIGFSLSAV